MKIAITGAAGHIGRFLAVAARDGGHALVLLDRRADVGIAEADVAEWQAGWPDKLVGCDALIHLAGSSHPAAGWTDVQGANIDGVLNICEAAARGGVRRIVFASSNWVVVGHRGSDVALDSQTPPAPINAYGASKLFGERVIRHYTEARGIEGVCVRIGYSQHRADDAPGPHMAQGLWGQRMFVSRRDLTDLLLRAATVPLSQPFVVVNGVSHNVGMAWDLEEARKTLGYVPVDTSNPDVTPALEAQEAAVADARRAVASIETLLNLRRW